jgi:hypothetical protein
LNRGLGKDSQAVPDDNPGTARDAEHWPMVPCEFNPLKHNCVVAPLAKYILRFRTRRLEKVIFTATTGRTGTLTLAKLFSAVPDCVAVHEAYPVMNGWVLKAASYGDTVLVDRVYRQIKSLNILRTAIGHRYYLEANHLFIKTFIENAVDDFGERIAVIHLSRPAVEVAASIYRLEDYPGTERGDYWWLDYRAPTNLIQIAEILESDAEFSHPFYKGLWYWHEVEARVAAWRARLPALKIVRFETEWLNDKQKMFELLDELGIRYEKQPIEAMVGVKEHTKEDQKTNAGLPGLQLRTMASRFQELLVSRQGSAG